MDGLLLQLTSLSGIYAYLAVLLVLLICGLGVPIPEDISLFAAGLLAYYGQANVYLMILISMFGVMAGDSALFMIGRRYGYGILKLRFFARFLSEERLAYVRVLIHRRGNRIFFFTRFAPGVRAAVFFSAGALGIPFRKFFFYDFAAALISVPTIVFLTYYFGDQIDLVMSLVKKTNTGIAVVIFAVVLVFVLKWAIAKRREKKQKLAA